MLEYVFLLSGVPDPDLPRLVCTDQQLDKKETFPLGTKPLGETQPHAVRTLGGNNNMCAHGKAYRRKLCRTQTGHTWQPWPAPSAACTCPLCQGSTVNGQTHTHTNKHTHTHTDAPQ